MSNRVFRHSAGGVAIAAAAALVILAIWPSGDGIRTASAEALRGALNSLDLLEAVEIASSTDHGPGTDVQPLWKGVAVRDVGFRLEGEGHTQIYNHIQRRQVTIEGDLVRIAEIRDATSLANLLQHFTADNRLQELRQSTQRDGGELRDELVQIDGRNIRRFSARDSQGRPVELEVDPQTWRVLHCVSWTLPTDDQPALRQRWAFAYPDATTIDRRMFDPPSTENAKVIREPAGRPQCMVNIRNLAMAVQLYASEHEDRLPLTIRDLLRYLPHEDEAAILRCEHESGERVTIEYRGPEQLGAKLLTEAMPAGILFVADIGPGKLLGFADGHVEYRANEP